VIESKKFETYHCMNINFGIDDDNIDNLFEENGLK